MVRIPIRFADLVDLALLVGLADMVGLAVELPNQQATNQQAPYQQETKI